MPQLQQLQVQQPKRKRTGLQVNFSPQEWARLQEIQAVIGSDALMPEPSIHALVLKAVRNYIEQFDATKGA